MLRVLCGQAGLRSELEIATDEMEKAQQRLAALEREKEVLQGTTSPKATQVTPRAAPNKLVEESLRNELQSQVCFTLSSCCVNSLHLPWHLEALLSMQCHIAV